MARVYQSKVDTTSYKSLSSFYGARTPLTQECVGRNHRIPSQVDWAVRKKVCKYVAYVSATE